MNSISDRNEFSYFFLLLKRLGFVLFLFTLTRLAFYFFNQHLLNVQSFTELLSYLFFGWRFDIAALTYINLLFILMSLIPFSFRDNKWYKKIQHLVYVIINGLAFALEFGDIGYFQFAFRRVNRSDLEMLGTVQNTTGNIIFDFWYLLAFAILFAFLLFLFVWKSEVYENRITTPFIQALIFLGSIFLCVASARGGIQNRPVMPLTAAKYAKDMANMPLVTNASLGLLFSVQQRYLDAKNYFPQSKVDQLFPIVQQFQPSEPFKNENVVVIILESFGKEYIGHFNEYEGNTPFLDSLIKQGTYIKQTYSNGSRSTEGMVAISAGIPSLMEDPLMFSAYQGNRVDGTAALLKKKGYHTSFYHGANEGSMEFERFSLLNGFDKYIDRNDYPITTDYDGSWGIWDVPFFQYFANELDETPAPFYAVFFSMTSHHPFKTEDWFEENYPDMEPLYRSVRYADFALQQFFETARQMDWYDNTLFIITADHIGESRQKKYKNTIGKYQVPILFYKPLSTIQQPTAKLMQHIDIQPSILDYLNYDLPFSTFGNSVFSGENNRYMYAFSSGVYKLLDGQYLLLHDGEETIGFYDYLGDPMLGNNLLGNKSEAQEEMELQLKLVVQQYRVCLRENLFVRH